MAFCDTIRQFADSVAVLKKCCQTEEATKHSLILPIIQLLGYNVFDPTEVVPEVDCDIRKNGDKCDYVIQHNGRHLILIECKHWTKDLDYYVSQLAGYFAGSLAHFGILTNGVEYRFYTDLDRANLMDEEPFLVVDMEALTDDSLEELEIFCKDVFNERMIMEKANDMKCLSALREEVRQELAEPSFELVTHFARRIYGQVPPKSVREHLRPLLIKVLSECLQMTENQRVAPPPPERGEVSEKQVVASENNGSILEIVKGILAGLVSPDRIQLFEGSGYSSIRLDGSQWWPIVKFKYTDYAKWIALGMYWPQSSHFYCNQQSGKIYIDSAEDIKTYEKDIRDIVSVMLMDGEDQDERRAAWVRRNRPDWCE